MVKRPPVLRSGEDHTENEGTPADNLSYAERSLLVPGKQAVQDQCEERYSPPGGQQGRLLSGRVIALGHQEGMQFSWRWDGGAICKNLDGIWGMSAKRDADSRVCVAPRIARAIGTRPDSWS